MRSVLRALGLVVLALGAPACAGPSRETRGAQAIGARAGASPAAEQVHAGAATPADAPEHWYFEWLSRDGKHALLRRLDAGGRASLQTRVVDVDTGAIVEEEAFPELGKLRFAAIGAKPSETSEVERILADPALGDDITRAARLAFPFGSFGRLSASSASGDAVAFNAGDSIYFADKSHAPRRLTAEAAYDPRFTPDGKHLLFRRVTGTIDRVFAKYELFVMPTDLSAPPRLLADTAGVHDGFVVDAERRLAVGVASREPQVKTCVLSVALRPPFNVKRLACLDGGEQLIEAVLSPKGRWAALTTQTVRRDIAGARDASEAACAGGAKNAKVSGHAMRRLSWRFRVVSLDSGKVFADEPEEPGETTRAVSDGGLVVRSGPRGVTVLDARARARRALGGVPEIGHRAFFRSSTELVIAQGASVGVIDLAKN